jgi:Uncharacterized conserved protein
MDVTKINIQLKSKDIKSIFTDFVQVPGLEIKEVEIKEKLIILGEYKFLRKIPFSVYLDIENVQNNKVKLKVAKVKISKLGLLKSIKNFALKKLMQQMESYGIYAEKENVIINLDILLKKLPIYLRFMLDDVKINNEFLSVDLEALTFSLSKEDKESKEDIEIEKNIIKREDKYSKVRANIEDKVPDKFEKIKEYIFILPDILALFYRLLKDERVPLKIKLMLGGVIAYLASPIELLPDFIPFIGEIDNIAISVYVLNKIINEVPENIILENWQGEINIIEKVKEIIEYINKIAGGTNVSKLIKTVKNAINEKTKAREGK